MVTEVDVGGVKDNIGHEGIKPHKPMCTPIMAVNQASEVRQVKEDPSGEPALAFKSHGNRIPSKRDGSFAGKTIPISIHYVGLYRTAANQDYLCQIRAQD